MADRKPIILTEAQLEALDDGALEATLINRSGHVVSFELIGTTLPAPFVNLDGNSRHRLVVTPKDKASTVRVQVGREVLASVAVTSRDSSFSGNS